MKFARAARNVLVALVLVTAVTLGLERATRSLRWPNPLTLPSRSAPDSGVVAEADRAQFFEDQQALADTWGLCSPQMLTFVEQHPLVSSVSKDAWGRAHAVLFRDGRPLVLHCD